MTDPVTKIIVLCASDAKSLKLTEFVKTLDSDKLLVINVNNESTLRQLKFTQVGLNVTVLPILVVEHESGSYALASVRLLPQLLNFKIMR